MITSANCGHEVVRAAAPGEGFAALTFRTTGYAGYRHSAQGTVPASGCMLSVHAALRLDEIDVTVLREGVHCGFRVSAADARALAAELLVAAAAMEG